MNFKIVDDDTTPSNHNNTDKMTTRPTVTIIGADGKASDKSHPLPLVFKAPIRSDIVQYESCSFIRMQRLIN